MKKRVEFCSYFIKGGTPLEQFIPILIFLIASLLLNKLGERNKEQNEQRHEQTKPTATQSSEQRPPRRMDRHQKGQVPESRHVEREERKPVTFDEPQTIREAAEIFLSQVEERVEQKKPSLEREIEKPLVIETIKDEGHDRLYINNDDDDETEKKTLLHHFLSKKVRS